MPYPVTGRPERPAVPFVLSSGRSSCLRAQLCGCLSAGLALALCLVLATVPPASAQGYAPYTVVGGTTASARGGVRVIGNDSGGRLRARFAEIRQIRFRGDRIEIRGSYCMSSCTLYLGAGNVCVSPATRFGFHGPSYKHRNIRAERFDYWSRRMATYYPPQISSWFLAQARYVTQGYLELSGADLIRMGVRAC